MVETNYDSTVHIWSCQIAESAHFNVVCLQATNYVQKQIAGIQFTVTVRKLYTDPYCTLY